jgi:hypothetical protein
MTDQAAVVAVYALARTQLDWIPTPPSKLRTQGGFAHGRDERGVQLRWLACPDCLANDRPMFGCETCGGRGEVPDAGRDPYEVQGSAPFFGEEHQQARDRARMVDAQIIRLRQLERARAGDASAIPEDWLTRALRLKAQQWQRGDYGLLEQWQEILGMRYPMRHLGWTSFVVEAQPLGFKAAVYAHLDETAAWLADRILSSIGAENARRRQTAELLAARPRLRPDRILVPVEHAAEPQTPGKGRWANGTAQGQRNATIVGLAAEGKTAGEIARRVGLTKRRVQALLAEAAGVQGASGPAA